MSGKVAAIRDACGSTEGEERGAKNLLSAVGSDFGGWVTGPLLLADTTKKIGGLFFFLFFSFFFYYVFVVKVQETAWSASDGVNKTLIQTTARFTPSWEKSNSAYPEHTLPPSST